MVGKQTVTRTLVAAAIALAAWAAPSTASADELRIATLAPDNSAWMKVLSRGAEEVKKATNGRVTIKIYANGVQGDEKDVVRKMGAGQLDGAALTSVGLSLIERSVRVLELPRLFNNEKELDYVRAKMWRRFQKRFEKKGYMLAPKGGDVGPIIIYTNKPIRAKSDFSGVKMWRWSEDQIVKAMFSEMGINGVPLGVPQVLSSLSTGRINGTYASPLAAVALQWHTKIKYATSLQLSYGIGGSVITKKAWDKISKEDQAAIIKIQKKQARKLRSVVRKDNRRALSAIKGAGVKVVDTPAALVAEIDAAAKKVWRTKAGSLFRKADLDKVLSLLAEKRK